MGIQVEPWLRIHEVFHPTDLSPAAEAAFVHALRVAVTAQARLTLMRVSPETPAAPEGFPDVRGTLERWRAHAAGGRTIPEIAVRRHAARGENPVKSCLQSLQRDPAELIVVATRQHAGKTTWLGESVAEPLARSSGEMTLLVPEGTAGFVRPEDGAVTLRSILVPVAGRPRPGPAIEAARRLMLFLPEGEGTATVLHVGDGAGMPKLQLPDVPGWTWNPVLQPGNVVDTILETAKRVKADLIAMTTEGRHGFLDALRGSTTTRVLREASCPLLTMPVGSFLG